MIGARGIPPFLSSADLLEGHDQVLVLLDAPLGDLQLVEDRSDPRLATLEHKESWAREMPFYRMKVRLKKEIVKLGVPGVDPNKMAGKYV